MPDKATATIDLLTKQTRFAHLVAGLISYAESLGYGVTLGEVWRSPETADLYEKMGKGISKSLHRLRLAIDINLFMFGSLIIKSNDYETIGVWWETQSTPGMRMCWGGRFGDGNHFSMEHNNVR